MTQNLRNSAILRPAFAAWRRLRGMLLPPPPAAPPRSPAPAPAPPLPPGAVRREAVSPQDFAPVPSPAFQRIVGPHGPDAFPRPSPDRPLVFSHSGKIGDLVFALPFCRAVASATGHDRFSVHLRTGTGVERVRADGFVFPMPQFNRAGAELLRPLLERQPYVESVTISDALPEGALDLDPFRSQTCIPLWRGNIPLYYLPLAPWLVDVPDLSKPWLFGGRRTDLGGKTIVLFATERSQRAGFSFSFLEPFRDEILFLGTDAEHAEFERVCFPVFHRKIADFAEALDVLGSARLVLGNQTGFFAMAEALKIPRLLLVPDRDANNIPCGGAFQLLHEPKTALTTFLAFHDRFCR